MMHQQDKQQNKQQDGTPQNSQNKLQNRFKMIQMASFKRIMAFLDENDVFHALDLLHKTYKIIFNSVKKNQAQDQTPEQEHEQEQTQTQTQTHINFTLFDDVADLIQKKLQYVSIQDLEAHINIKCFFDILKTAAITGNSSTTQSVRKFMKSLGSYISSRLKVKEAYNKTVWGNIFSYLVWNSGYYDSDEIVNECAALEHIKQSHLLAFDYYYGLLTNGITDVIKEYFYTAFIKNVSIELKGGERGQQRAKYRLFLAITAYAYTYYLAEKALLDTSAEECKSAKSVIEDKSVKESFYVFTNRLAGRSELSDILSKSFSSDIENFLYRYEIIAYDSNNKFNHYTTRNISSGLAAREFFLFFAGFIAMYCYDDKKCASMLDSAFTVEEIRYYLSTEQERDTIAMFTNFFNLIKRQQQDVLNNEYSSGKNYAEKLYYTLSIWLTDKEVDLAKKEQSAFEEDVNYADQLRFIAEEQLKRDFKGLLEKDIRDIENRSLPDEIASDDVKILEIPVLTHMAHDKEFIKSNIINVSSKALFLIINLLEKCHFGCIRFISIKEYLETLKKYNIKTLIGGESKISGIDFTRSPEEWQQAKKEIENYTTIHIPMANVAIALEEQASLSFKYSYITAYIRPLSDEEIEKDVESKDASYRYRGDNLSFGSIDELKAYVRNRRKMLTVNTLIRLQNAKDNNRKFMGFIFS